MIKDEAIEKVRDAGFSANGVHWKLGDCIFCGKESRGQDDHPLGSLISPTRFDRIVYLFPTSGGWGLELPDILPATDFGENFSLEEATDLVLGILGSPFIPLRENELEITVANGISGDGSWILHKPTGIRRDLFYSQAGQRRTVMLTKDEALREIVYELARSWNQEAANRSES